MGPVPREMHRKMVLICLIMSSFHGNAQSSGDNTFATVNLTVLELEHFGAYNGWSNDAGRAIDTWWSSPAARIDYCTDAVVADTKRECICS